MIGAYGVIEVYGVTESERLAMTDGEAHVGVLVMTEEYGMIGAYGMKGRTE